MARKYVAYTCGSSANPVMCSYVMAASKFSNPLFMIRRLPHLLPIFLICCCCVIVLLLVYGVDTKPCNSDSHPMSS